MTEQQYLERHIAKADLELRKIAFPYKSGKFQSDNRTKYIIEHEEGRLGVYKAIKNTIAVDTKYFNNMYKRKYNKELLTVLQHEIIHKYINYWLDNNTINYDADNSPAFLAFLAFFNARGCNIRANHNFDKDFKFYNKELYTFAVDKNTTFIALIIKLQRIAENIKEHFKNKAKIEEGKEKVGFGYSCVFTNDTYTTAKLVIQRNIYKQHIFTINTYMLYLSSEFNVTDLDSEFNKETLEWACSGEGLATEGEVIENEDVVINIPA